MRLFLTMFICCCAALVGPKVVNFAVGQTCSTCTGSISCPPGASPSCQNGTWTCSDGSSGCTNPPPASYCGPGYAWFCTTSGWQCQPTSCPIIIDPKGEGFHLTNLERGVSFRFFPAADPVQISWTTADSNNGFLVLDRNGNGTIDDGSELFGSMTSQPPSEDPNGYEALKVFDARSHGGNGNGIIDPGDAVYRDLRLWIDKNHNGVSEPDELLSMSQVGIRTIALSYTRNAYVDIFGNEFRYQTDIIDRAGHNYRTCYDVFLLVSHRPGSLSSAAFDSPSGLFGRTFLARLSSGGSR